jgi:16S rRNA processing protein RimM
MSKDECYLLGYISKTHGVEGELCFFIDADDPGYYKKMESVFIDLNKQLVPFFISHISSIKKNIAVVKLEDVDFFDQAEKLVGKELYLPLSFLPKLTGNRFYFHEIVGYTVVDKNLGVLGKITEVMDMPQQIIAQMEYKEKEVLFPINDLTLIKLDRSRKELLVELPEGLLEVYL